MRLNSSMLALGPLALALLASCAETYCQSGAKYGTECYSGADVQAERRAQGRQEPPAEMKWWVPPSARPAPPPAPMPPPTVAPASSSSSADAGAPVRPKQ
jgi:hypothetical protein